MKFTTQNNNKEVMIGVASLEDAFALQDAILSTLKDNGLDLEGFDGDMMQQDVSAILPAILSSGMSLLASKDVRSGLFDCFLKCTYDGEKITTRTFEDVAAREDYYEVAMACVKANCAPFLKSLLSGFSSLGLDQTKLGSILK